MSATFWSSRADCANLPMSMARAEAISAMTIPAAERTRMAPRSFRWLRRGHHHRSGPLSGAHEYWTTAEEEMVLGVTSPRPGAGGTTGLPARL